MLAKKFRLNRRQVQLVIQKGRGQNFGLFGLKFLKNNLDFNRYAVVVAKKVASKATVRNRLRRVIFNELADVSKPGFDCIVRLYRLPEDEKILRLAVAKSIQEINV